MEVYKEWKKDIEDKLKKLPKEEREKFPIMVKRCPKCHKMTLEFDPKTGRFFCTSCGFEVTVEMAR